MSYNWKQIKNNYITALVSILILCNIFTLSGLAYRNTSHQQEPVKIEWRAKFKLAKKSLFYKKHCAGHLSSKTFYDGLGHTYTLLHYEALIKHCLTINKTKITPGNHQIIQLKRAHTCIKSGDASSECEIG